ncbi:MAG: glycosyltransferase family 4 protein [Myxococcales bacterium]|nr:glycosyltransferase family 4 protein [Myxococcales bacterium]
MRVLYLTPGCFDKGGISRYSRYQIRALRDLLGADNVSVLSLLGPGDDSFEEPFEVDWHGSGADSRSKLELVARASSLAAKLRPDAVHVAHVNFAGLARCLGSAVKATVILNVYGLEVWSGFRPDAEWGLRRADLVVSDCHFTASYLLEAGLRSVAPTVIWDCVDLDSFTPKQPSPAVLARYGLPDPALGVNLLTLGRMQPGAEHKGYDRLYQVFRRVAPELPELSLIFAGRGTLADELREQARRDGLAERVHFTGMVHEDDLPDIYRAASIFSLVSDRGVGRGEGIPLTPLEASACGAPILVGDHDGSQEAVVHGVNGFVLDPFDLDEHARRLVELARSPELRARMGSAARRRVEAEFGYPKFRERHRQLLRRWFPATAPSAVEQSSA